MPEIAELGLRSSDLDAAVAEAELAVIVMAHPGVDYAAIAARVPAVDFCGVLRASAVHAGTSG